MSNGFILIVVLWLIINVIDKGCICFFLLNNLVYSWLKWVVVVILKLRILMNLCL